MIDEKLLDSMNFGELSEALDYTLETMGKIEDERSEGEDDPRLDMLLVVANKIVMQMDAIIRESGNPAALAQWNQAKGGYEEHFQKYKATYLKEDTLLDSE